MGEDERFARLHVNMRWRSQLPHSMHMSRVQACVVVVSSGRSVEPNGPDEEEEAKREAEGSHHGELECCA